MLAIETIASGSKRSGFSVLVAWLTMIFTGSSILSPRAESTTRVRDVLMDPNERAINQEKPAIANPSKAIKVTLLILGFWSGGKLIPLLLVDTVSTKREITLRAQKTQSVLILKSEKSNHLSFSGAMRNYANWLRSYPFRLSQQNRTISLSPQPEAPNAMSATMILVKPTFSSLNRQDSRLQIRQQLDFNPNSPVEKKRTTADSAKNAVANAFRNCLELAGNCLGCLTAKPAQKKSQTNDHASKANSNDLFFGTSDFDISFFGHEVRTPLNSVLGFLQLLEMGAYGEIPTEARHRLLIAQKNLGRIINLAEELLTMEKNGSVSLKLNLQRCELSSIIQTTMEAVTEFAAIAGIEIECDIEDAVIEADPDRLSQVFINLVSNAVKYSPNGSKIKISSVFNRGQIEIRVNDEGPGIADGAKDSIFKPFCQFGTTERQGGVGLGLFIAKSIVNLHSGEIGVDSKRGEGSSFWVRFPVSAKLNQEKSFREGQQRKNLPGKKAESRHVGLSS